MAKSSDKFKTLNKKLDVLAEELEIDSILIMKSNTYTMQVEASAGNLEDTYPIGAKGNKSSVTEDTHKLYCEEVVNNNEPLFVKNSSLAKEWIGNEDEVEFGLINYLGYPVKGADGEIFGTVCVLNKNERDYSDAEKQKLLALKQDVEKILISLK